MSSSWSTPYERNDLLNKERPIQRQRPMRKWGIFFILCVTMVVVVDAFIGTTHRSDIPLRGRAFRCHTAPLLLRSKRFSDAEEHECEDNKRTRITSIASNKEEWKRRSFVDWAVSLGAGSMGIVAVTTTMTPLSAMAAGRGGRSNNGFFAVNKRTDASSSEIIQSTVTLPQEEEVLSSEECLLKLLPVRNKVLRQLEKDLLDVSVVRTADLNDGVVWKTVCRNLQGTLKFLDDKRSRLEPVFNQEDSTELSIAKSMEGEQLIEALRNQLVALVNASAAKQLTATVDAQKAALLALGQVGELLVEKFPFDVPEEGKFAFLPRLMGRTRVTFGIKRPKVPGLLGNITIVADGYAAPLTAGNFVDLALRGFYTGLAIKNMTKRFGAKSALFEDDSGSSGVVVTLPKTLERAFAGRLDSIYDDGETKTMSIPILGSYEEGFYDPLTAKPRRVPLEIVRLDPSGDGAKLTYAQGFSKLTSATGTDGKCKPLLNFNIPGLVCLNHPDRSLNSGNSEFFSLPKREIAKDTSALMLGQYAPFGYIIDGFDLYQDLKEGDIIDSTFVSERGALNLIKLRGKTFADVIEGTSGSSD
eukprot:scaffold55275_cov48-Attheya_sp.AAC.3